jgi:CRP-like cAMP-binding protein
MARSALTTRTETGHEPLVHQLETIAELSDADRAVFAALPLRVRDVAEGHEIVRLGDRPSESCLVIEGLLCRYKPVGDGGRQILSLHFPGDMPDLQSLQLEVMDHALVALTPSRIGLIPHSSIKAAMDRYPGVRAALVRHMLVDASICRQWLANVGRRTGLQRVAALLCECCIRSHALGLADRDAFVLPITQAEIGDATGLSYVHVNRTLQTLRRCGLIRSNGAAHEILDWEELCRIADFDPSYLHLRERKARRRGP